MNLVKYNVRVGQFLLEKQLLNENAVCHVYDSAILIFEGLHPYVIANLRPQLATHLLRYPDCQTSGSYSPGLADGYPSGGIVLPDGFGDLG